MDSRFRKQVSTFSQILDLHTSDRHTAILLFVRSQREELQAKELGNKAVVHYLNKRINKVVAQTGLPVYRFTTTKQKGHSFGERLNHAIGEVFSKGYQSVIAIGNDCLEVRTTSLLDVAKQLETQEVVLGPSADGGVYLIGLKRQAFRTETFVQLPWQTKDLCQAFLKTWQQEGYNAALLPSAIDIDDLHSLHAAIDQFDLQDTFVRILSNLITLVNVFTQASARVIDRRIFSSPSLRAPPF